MPGDQPKRSHIDFLLVNKACADGPAKLLSPIISFVFHLGAGELSTMPSQPQFELAFDLLHPVRLSAPAFPGKRSARNLGSRVS